MGTNRQSSFLTNFASTIASVILAAVCLIVFYGVAPAIETRLAPVYSHFEPVLIEQIGETAIRVQFRYEKKRACAPTSGSFGWYVGDPGTSFRRINIKAEVEQPTVASRPVGWQLSNVYLMDVSVEQFQKMVWADIFNNCHVLWPTRTVIFP